MIDNTLKITANGQVMTKVGTFTGILLSAGAGAVAQVTLYDGTSNAGTEIAKVNAAIGASTTYLPINGIAVKTGIFAEITGVGAAAYVNYN